MKIKTFLILIFFLLLPQIAGAIGAYFTFPAIDSWYQFLNKPTWSPPNWLFGPAWTTLYFLMGLASFFIWQKREDPKAKKALTAYLLHLPLNSLWSIIFFGLKSPLGALIEIIFLWVAILYLTISFFKIKKASGWLFLPYLLWTSFASALNLAIVLLN
ncbi:MAG: TspO/MBR family protein [Patescibacteria group bacterium]|jgi:benzodiazapine receptor